jgi:hypothetical protein
VFRTAKMYQNTPSFTWDSYNSMWLPLVMQSVTESALQWYSKCRCLASATKTFTYLKGVQTIHRSGCWALFLNTLHFNLRRIVFSPDDGQSRRNESHGFLTF